MKSSHLYPYGLAVLFAGTAVMPAVAQEDYFSRDRYTSVTERTQPDFDPTIIRLGAFEARPELRAGVGSRSNLFADDQNEVSDTFFILAPSLGLQTTWSRHQLGAQLEVNHREYQDTSEESKTDLAARVFGELEASSQLSFTGAVTGSEKYEARSSAARVFDAAEPVQVNRLGGEAGVHYRANRLKVDAGIGIDMIDYMDVSLRNGLIQDQDFRDVDETVIKARTSWAMERDWAVFGEVVYIDRDYDAPVIAAALNRDSQGTIVRVGTDFELSSLIRGDLAIGYQTFEYDDARLSSVDGVSVEAELQWFVTQLTTLTGSAARDISDPGLVGSAAVVETSVGVRADHELRRNWLIFGEVDVANLDFETINRSDDRVNLGVGTTWKLNKNIWLDGSYRRIDQDSDVRSFDDNRFVVALRLFP